MLGTPSAASATSGMSAPAAAGSAQGHCRDILDAALVRSPAIIFACMARVDGLAYASASSSTALVEPQRSSAIVSSLLALSESFAREALRSKCLYTTIATEHGSIVTVRVPSRTPSFALCLCVDNGENLAMALRLALGTADMLAAAVDAA